MPVGSHKLFATIVGIERTMVDHPLEAVFLPLVALPVYPEPRGRLQGVLDYWGSPIHQGFALCRLDNHKVSGITWPGHFPGSALDHCAILKGTHRCGLKALQAIMLIVIEHR